jgi:hypothetical protein
MPFPLVDDERPAAEVAVIQEAATSSAAARRGAGDRQNLRFPAGLSAASPGTSVQMPGDLQDARGLSTPDRDLLALGENR